MSLQRRLDQATQILSDAGIEGSARDARLLVAYVHGVDAGLLSTRLRDEDGWGAAQENHFFECVHDRAKGKPIAKITGYKAFWNSDFWVTGDVLDPRPDTETLVECALKLPFRSVLDLGTGSGCILISLLQERSAAEGLGVDISTKALKVATENARRLGVADRAAFKCSNMFDGISTERFDLIVSNPPYISLSEMQDLAQDVMYDPRLALTDEGDGLAFYRLIAARAKAHLNPLGAVLVEIGHKQGNQVAAMFAAQGFHSVEVCTDLNGKDRVVMAKR